MIADQNQQLEELNRMKDRFIAGISHEFRTPLTLIFGSLEMAEEKLRASNPEEIEGYLERIGSHSQKLRDLIDQFLELSKLEAGMSVMHKSTLSLTKFSAGITAAFTSLADQNKIEYKIDLPDDTVWIETDRSKLEMAVNNILKNAFKFRGPGEGTVNDLPGNRWKSYIPTADHPEYPSASAYLCSATAEASRQFLGSDKLFFSWNFPEGSSTIEPGVTPSEDTKLSWSTWTEWENDCGNSRFWGGMHFMESVRQSKDPAHAIGKKAHEFVESHIEGEVE